MKEVLKTEEQLKRDVQTQELRQVELKKKENDARTEMAVLEKRLREQTEFLQMLEGRKEGMISERGFKQVQKENLNKLLEGVEVDNRKVNGEINRLGKEIKTHSEGVCELQEKKLRMKEFEFELEKVNSAVSRKLNFYENEKNRIVRKIQEDNIKIESLQRIIEGTLETVKNFP